MKLFKYLFVSLILLLIIGSCSETNLSLYSGSSNNISNKQINHSTVPTPTKIIPIIGLTKTPIPVSIKSEQISTDILNSDRSAKNNSRNENLNFCPFLFCQNNFGAVLISKNIFNSLLFVSDFSAAPIPGVITGNTATPTSTSSTANIDPFLGLPNVQSRVEAFIRVPSDLIQTPYVILSGYQTFSSDSSNISITGEVNNSKFFCESSPCAVSFPDSGKLVFYAINEKGETSNKITADILVSKLVDGYSVTIISISSFTMFSDSCANIWKTAGDTQPFWSRFPQDPSQLHTEKNLHYLAMKLIKSGIVNTSDCPNGGWDSDIAPNACGLEKAKAEMIKWQNRFDMDIWQVSRDEHIPPIILKSLLEIESQFWPISQRKYLDELGLGQINQLGIDVLLRTNPELYAKVCSQSLFNCQQPYFSLSGLDRSLIRGTLAQSLDATCPTCTYGIDLNKAAQSIPLIAKVIYANCVQAKSILDLYKLTANYEDSWKFTLVSYHSGFGCLQNAIEKSTITKSIISWKIVAGNLDCPGSVDYVNRFWTSVVGFNYFLQSPEQLPIIPLIAPTPMPTPTMVYSKSRIIVKIFLDKNGDGIQQPDEYLDDIQVNLDLENGVSISQFSKNGLVTFNLDNLPVGLKGRINLPGLYRSASVLVEQSGDKQIVFIFSRPIIPTANP